MKWKRAGNAVPGEERKPQEAASIPAFAPVFSDGFELLKDLPLKMEVPRGSVLQEQGRVADSVYLLRSGLVKLHHGSPEGREITLGLRTAGWYAGAVSAMTGTPSVYSVIAVTACEFSRIPAAAFSQRLMQSARMMRHFVNTLSHELIAQSATQACLMSGSAEERLARFMRERNGTRDWTTLDALPLLKQMELAQLLSITPEHLSRLLHRNPAASASPERLT